MNRFLNLVIALVLLCLGVHAGNPPETQDDYVRELMRFSGNIHQFNNIFPQEKVYLEFDNTAYFQGEAIWFKAFVTHATTLQRAPSKVLYVDFLSPTGQLIQQQKLKVVAGQCDGVIVLWDAATAQAREKRGILEYPSGFYEIRAYTQNMLDFGREAVFSRVIPVYTKPKRKGDFDNSIVLLKDNPLIEEIREDADEKERKVNLSFYPEGGNLIAGLPCNVAFKATGADGFELEGAVVYQDGADTAYTIHDGMGLFNIVPNKSENVHFITKDGKRTRFNLPKILKSGYSMIALPCSDSLIQVSIARTPDLIGEPTALAVTCRGDLIYFRNIPDDNGSQLDIDCSNWPIGVCRMTLYNKDGKILSSRSIFHNNARFKSPTIAVSTDSLSRQPFNKEILSFKLTDKDGNPIRDRFCLSVRDASDYGTGITENLQSNLLLSSDLKGYIHDPAWYLAANDEQHRTALNLLTLVQGWERYEWQYMTGQTVFSEKHRVEDSLTMNGWVLSYTRRKPVSEVEVLASVQHTDDKTMIETFEYDTDSTGYFGFDLTDFYGKAKMTINLMSKRRWNQSKSKYEKSTRIKFERSEKPEPKPFLKQETDLTRNKRNNPGYEPDDFKDDDLPLVIKESTGILLDDVDIIEKRQFVDYDTFTAWDVEQETEMELDMGEYSSFVIDFLMDKGFIPEYNDFGTITHLRLNNIEAYRYVHNREKVLTYKPFDIPWVIDMIDVKSIIIYDKPMYLTELKKFTPLLNEHHSKRLDTEWFDPVDWQADEDAVGGGRIGGDRYYLVDILIKDDRELLFYNEIYNLGRRTTTIDGFSKPVEFYGPEYPEGPVFGEVDLRRTVYWNPNVITDTEGNARVEFYNNSYTRRFTISGAGITASGIPYILNQSW